MGSPDYQVNIKYQLCNIFKLIHEEIVMHIPLNIPPKLIWWFDKDYSVVPKASPITVKIEHKVISQKNVLSLRITSTFVTLSRA